MTVENGTSGKIGKGKRIEWNVALEDNKKKYRVGNDCSQDGDSEDRFPD